ncbi:MAG: hypothetical protein HKP58_15330, partial [Desulfatitalea sp.]|nr:50S ribosomal protein L11 methyltransferase [Desulfatitalea sp.]NNK01782.1 hypothetical protein [Desulfatitalea sp.]
MKREENFNATEAALRATVRKLLGLRHLRLTPTDLLDQLCTYHEGLSRRAARSVMMRLVAAGDLVYTHHYSISHLELGQGPRRWVTPALSIGKAVCRSRLADGEINIRLHDGMAFGGGDHPTTCLALRGMSHLLDRSIIRPRPSLTWG